MRKAVLTITLLAIAALQVGAAQRIIEIKARKFFYKPHIIRVRRGDEITIRLISEDVQHGFFLDGYGVRTSAYPGQDGSVSFIADKTGRYNFRCSVTCGEFHPFMVGYLVVGPNIRFYLFIVIIGLIGLASLAIVLKSRKKGVPHG